MALTSTQDIIQKFELYIGDSTELSSSEELDLLQKKYNEVLASEEWEFLKKEATGTISGTEISQPQDFDRLTSNQNIFIGSNQSVRNIIPFDLRREYRNNRGYAYYDARNQKFIFTATENDTYSFDYIFVPPALDTVSSNPIFPQRFWDVLYHAMTIDADIINLSDKARSYADFNRAMYDSILADMKSWNKKISGYNTYGV